MFMHRVIHKLCQNANTVMHRVRCSDVTREAGRGNNGGDGLCAQSRAIDSATRCVHNVAYPFWPRTGTFPVGYTEWLNKNKGGSKILQNNSAILINKKIYI